MPIGGVARDTGNTTMDTELDFAGGDRLRLQEPRDVASAPF